MAGKECVIKMMTECGVIELNDTRLTETLNQLQMVNKVGNFTCRDHVKGTHSPLLLILVFLRNTNSMLS